MEKALSIALCAIGNRCFGSNVPHSKWLGVIIVAIGLTVSMRGAPWWYLPLNAISFFLFRNWTARPWLSLMSTTYRDWSLAILRSFLAAIIPVVKWSYDGDPYHLLAGIALCFLIPLSYYFAGKYGKKQPVEVAEMATGALIGAA